MSPSLNPRALQFFLAPHRASLSVVISVAICLFTLWTTGSINSSVTAAPAEVPEGYSSELIDVRFREGTDVEPPEETLPPDLRNAVASIRRGFSLSEEQLNEIRMTGESLSGDGLPNLNLWFQITLKPGTDAVAFIADLQALESVEHAEFVPLPPPPPQAMTPNFEGRQGYLDPAPGGIDARFSLDDSRR